MKYGNDRYHAPHKFLFMTEQRAETESCYQASSCTQCIKNHHSQTKRKDLSNEADSDVTNLLEDRWTTFVCCDLHNDKATTVVCWEGILDQQNDTEEQKKTTEKYISKHVTD